MSTEAQLVLVLPKIGVVSASARDWRLGLDYPVMFARDVSHLLFEPDPESVEEMLRSSPRTGDMELLPFALSNVHGNATLRVTSSPDCSSLRDVDDSYLNGYSEVFRPDERSTSHETYFDASHRECFRVQRSVQVQTRTLDALIDTRALTTSVFSPDVVSLDLPGTEFEALVGARACLSNHTLSVVVRTDFSPRYRGQKLFGDIHELLAQAGFQLAQFMSIEEASSRQLPIGVRARDRPIGARCLFLRRIGSLEQSAPSSDALHLRALKLAFLSVLYGQFSTAQEALDMARSSPASPTLRGVLSHLSYPAFLERFENTTKRVPPHKLHSSSEAAAKGFSSRLETYLQSPRPNRTVATGGWLVRKAAGAARRLKRAWTVLKGRMPLNTEDSTPPPWYVVTELESLLQFYGFWRVASVAYERRTRLHLYARQGDDAE